MARRKSFFRKHGNIIFFIIMGLTILALLLSSLLAIYNR